jgi:tRNA-uridine 2-sulfurtransferase
MLSYIVLLISREKQYSLKSTGGLPKGGLSPIIGGMQKRVFIAISGGVDSSVSAHLLKQAGYEVAGIHLQLYPRSKEAADKNTAELERTCQLLDISLYYLNLETEFYSRIIGPFCREYENGRTPNPCIQCNRIIKFGRLLERVKELGGDYLATGHYARIEKSGSVYLLKKGLDQSKDQSYFLYMLGRKELASVLFPVGGMRKSEVKKIAAGLGLPAAEKPESQDICFIPNNDNRAFLSSRLTARPGEIADTDGKVLGQHKGLAFYTVGQRQGMGVSASQPLYVLRMETQTNRLIVGFQSQLYRDSLTAGCINWVAGQSPEKDMEVSARIRYRTTETKATLHIEDNNVHVYFAEPQRAIAPGQSVVFYQGDTVLGGGLIE